MLLRSPPRPARAVLGVSEAASASPPVSETYRRPTAGVAAMVFTQCSRPGADFPPLAGLAGSVFVAFLFEGADLRGDLRLGLPFAVTAIWPAVVPDSHRDAAMPFAVPAEVDARPAIRTPSSG